MQNKIARLITNNFHLKVIAAIVAVMMWLLVVNTDDPEITRQFYSTVSVENGSYLTDSGLYYDIVEGTDVVYFNVTAKRSNMDKLSTTDFKAVANLENAVVPTELGKVKVPIEVSAIRYSGLVSIGKPASDLEITVENLVTEQFMITANSTGDVADGYATGNVSVSPNIIRISGPESMVNRIGKVVATVDVSNMSSDVVASVIPQILDADGIPLDKSKLSLSVAAVNVSSGILDVKTVPINFSVSGTPQAGYRFVNVRTDVNSVEIKGSASALNEITAINIPESGIDISGATGDVTQVIDLSVYLPDGVTVKDTSKAKVTVNCHIAKIVSRAINLFASDIEIRNLSDDLTVYYPETAVKVNVTAVEEVINRINSGNMGATIDLLGYKEGEYTVDVVLDLGMDVDYDDVRCLVTLIPANDTEENNANDEPTDSSSTVQPEDNDASSSENGVSTGQETSSSNNNIEGESASQSKPD